MNLTLFASEKLEYLSPETIGIIDNGGGSGRLTPVQVIRHIITPAVCLISMGALIFTLILLHRKKLVRITALIYLKCMGFVDLLSLIFIFILSLDYSSKSFFKAQKFSPALHGCLFGFLFTSNWLMTAQAIERTIAISKPFKAKQIREKHRRIVVSVIFILSVLFTIPTLVLDIMQTERYQEDPGDFHKDGDGFSPFFNKFKNDINLHQFNVNQTYSLESFVPVSPSKDKWPRYLVIFEKVQSWLVYFVLFFILPFVCLCLTSFYLLSAVKMSGRFVRQHCIRGGVEFRNTLREEARMTVLTLCLIGAFFICQSPFVIYQAFTHVGLLSRPSHEMSLVRALIHLALALKSDCTFVFHCWLNQRFALALRRMLCSFSSNTASGRCHGSKSYSQEDSQNQYNSRQGQTRSLIKHHAIQQTSRADEKQMKILLKEIDFKQRAGCHRNQNFNKSDEKSPTSIKASITYKKLDMRKRSIPIEEALRNSGTQEPVSPKASTDDTIKGFNYNPRIMVTLEAKEIKDFQPILQKKCCKKQSRFFSENDLCTSCTTTGCSCGLSCQATSICSSLDCTAETSTQCRYSLTKSFSLPPLNSMNGPYHAFPTACDDL